MLTCYFGVPGTGKTTFLASIAVKELKKIQRGKSKYNAVYTNFYCKGCNKIEFDDLKKYKLYDSLILLDEITLDADNRKFKQFTDDIRDMFILHRHLGLDIIYATQSFELVDLKIRQLTQELWYLSRSVVPFLNKFTTAKRIYRNISINEYSSELTLGYRFCNLIESFFTSNYKIRFLPLYYKYFDSYDESVLENRSIFISSIWGDFPKGFELLNYVRSIGRKVNVRFFCEDKERSGTATKMLDSNES